MQDCQQMAHQVLQYESLQLNSRIDRQHRSVQGGCTENPGRSIQRVVCGVMYYSEVYETQEATWYAKVAPTNHHCLWGRTAP